MACRVSRVRLRPAPSFLEDVHRPQALLVMPESSWEQAVEHHLSDVAERRMPDIVAERGGFHQVLVEAERPGNRSGNLGYFERVGEARDEMITDGGDEDLRLVLHAPEGVGMYHAVAVALELGAQVVRRLRPEASRRRCAEGREPREALRFPRLQPLSHDREPVVSLGRRHEFSVPRSADVRRAHARISSRMNFM